MPITHCVEASLVSDKTVSQPQSVGGMIFKQASMLLRCDHSAVRNVKGALELAQVE